MTPISTSAPISITTTVIPDAVAWLRENLADYSLDGVSAIRPAAPKNLPETPRIPEQITAMLDSGGTVLYYDREEGRWFRADLSAHVTALQKLCDQIGQTLFVGGLKSPAEVAEPGNWDVEVWDAFFQLVTHGEVIYG